MLHLKKIYNYDPNHLNFSSDQLDTSSIEENDLIEDADQQFQAVGSLLIIILKYSIFNSIFLSL